MNLPWKILGDILGAYLYPKLGFRYLPAHQTLKSAFLELIKVTILRACLYKLNGTIFISKLMTDGEIMTPVK